MATDSNAAGCGTDGARWRNLITGECRDTPPPPGELDWIEATIAWHCPD